MRKDNKNKIARSYAEALYETAEDFKMLAEVKIQSDRLQNLFDEDKNILSYLSNPFWNNKAKAKALTEIADKMKLPVILKNMMKTAAENGRAKYLPLIFKEFTKVFFLKQNITPVTVYSAVCMSLEQKAKLQEALEKYTENRVNINYCIDPKILGGLLVECQSELIDDSVLGKLERIKMLMKGKAELCQAQVK